MKKLNQQQFLEKSKSIHGDLYDYSCSIYSNIRTPINIICKYHGLFLQKPNLHLAGCGCPQCNKRGGKINASKFLKKANHLYGSKFDFSQTVYRGMDQTIKVKCLIHNVFFEILPHSLFRKTMCGCPLCRQDNCNLKYTTETFILKAKSKWGNEFNYDLTKLEYSLSEYDKRKTRIIIVCSKGHKFTRRPRAHLCFHHGCPICSKQLKTNTDCIKEFKDVHKDTYDYSKVFYKSKASTVTIICASHGEFQQLPSVHKRGGGCPICAVIRKRKTTIQFIKEARLKHGKLYDYSKVNYINRETKVDIICQTHGKFAIRAGDHIRKSRGCPICLRKGAENFISTILVENNVKFEAQKRFVGCQSKRQLAFDFYLSEYNTCIEYDGLHHYLPIHGYEVFEGIKLRDQIKNQFCKQNGIALIRIRGSNNIKPTIINLLYPISI